MSRPQTLLPSLSGKKMHISFAMPFCILNVIILPRQARDKRRENSKKRVAFSCRQLEDHLADSKWPVATQKDGSSCIWPVYAYSQHIR